MSCELLPDVLGRLTHTPPVAYNKTMPSAASPLWFECRWWATHAKWEWAKWEWAKWEWAKWEWAKCCGSSAAAPCARWSVPQQRQAELSGLPTYLSCLLRSACVGYAIVHSVDLDGRALHLITPLPDDALETVNFVQKGSLELPSLFWFQSNTGHPELYFAQEMSAAAVGSGHMKSRNNILRRGHVE